MSQNSSAAVVIGALRVNKQPGIFFAVLGRGPPRAFEIGKISAVNFLIGKFVIMHNYVIFGH